MVLWGCVLVSEKCIYPTNGSEYGRQVKSNVSKKKDREIGSYWALKALLIGGGLSQVTNKVISRSRITWRGSP